MSLQRNYYEVLGLPPGATTDQIKKKYRELARKFHPDVVQDKALGQRVFSQINQAYSVLGDPERRAQYNGTLTQPGSASSSPSAQSASAAAPQAAAPGAAVSGVSATSAAAPSAAKAAAPSTAASPPASAAPMTAQKRQALAEMLGRAENAIMAGKPIEARAFCVRILEMDTRNVRALELLGDALGQMGRQEEAAVQYRNALQIAPSLLIQSKLNRITQAASTNRTAPPQSSAAARDGGGGRVQRTTPPGGDASGTGDGEKSGSLLGRLLGRK